MNLGSDGSKGSRSGSAGLSGNLKYKYFTNVTFWCKIYDYNIFQ